MSLSLSFNFALVRKNLSFCLFFSVFCPTVVNFAAVMCVDHFLDFCPQKYEAYLKLTLAVRPAFWMFERE